MSPPLPTVTLVRHGETAWSLSGQHTGRTDLPLTPRGEDLARRLGARLVGRHFAHVLTGPQLRARRTCELAGFGGATVIDPDLAEWDYGAYEGRTSADIRRERPDWQLFRDGCPNGESVAAVGARADRVAARLRQLDADVLLFSSGHILRVLACRWLGLDPSAGRLLLLGTASVSALSYDHGRDEPALKLWNQPLE